MSGWFALLGSGEFEPWSRAVDAWMLDRVTGDGRVLVVPTASAPEGDDVFTGWATKGLQHFAAAGVRAELLDVRDRTDADDREIAARVTGASIIYFSGGNPAYLARVLHNSNLWRSITDGLDRGMGYIGCSAGIASLGRKAPDSRVSELAATMWTTGLALFPRTWFGPHWDALDNYNPGLTAFIRATVPEGDLLVGVDEETALVGDGERWQVLGGSQVHIRDGGGEWLAYGEGSEFVLPLGG